MYGVETSNKAWTDEISKAVAAIGERKHLKVLYSSPPDEAAWLWDLVWLDCDAAFRNFKGVRLVCEIEWGHSDTEHVYDFMKLVAAEAVYRVFTFTAPSRSPADRFRLLMDFSAELPGRRYLAIGVPNTRVGDLPWKAWTT